MTSRQQQQQQQPTVSVKPSVWSPIYQVRRLSSKFLSKEAVHNPAFRNVRNPYAYTIWQAIRVRDTIIPTIAPVLCAVLVESVVVAVVFLVYKVPINLDDRMISMMGSAIAMLLAFRTNRSFERYNQGSQLWTNLTNQIRHSARLIWTTITPTTEDGKQEKLKIMKLLLATAVATKHALRGVDPYHFKDLNQLLPEDFVTQGKLSPRLRRRDSVLFKEGVASSLDEMFGSGGIGLSPTNASNRNSSSSRNTEKLKAIPPLPSKINNATTTSPTTTATTVKFTNNQDTDNETPTLSNRRHSIATPTMLRVHSRLTSETPSTASSSSRSYSRITLTNNNTNSPTLPLPPSLHARKCIGNVINVPLDILHHINHYVRTQRKPPLSTLTPEDATPTLTAISTAIDSVTKFEQILYFPVPTTYEIHIKQVLLLYFILLPFQLVKPMGWAMVVATFVMSVTFFGVDAIAGEISDPFGTDENDLPLDYFCVKLKDDLEYIMDGQFDVGGGWVGSGSEAEEEEEGEVEGEVEYRNGKKRIISVCGNGGSSGGVGGVHGSSIETAHEVGDRSSNNRGTPMQLRKRK